MGGLGDGGWLVGLMRASGMLEECITDNCTHNPLGGQQTLTTWAMGRTPNLPDKHNAVMWRRGRGGKREMAERQRERERKRN